MNLTAMTYNIRSGRDLAGDLNLEHAASVIRAVQPDFVILNEVRNRTRDVGDVNQAHALGRLTGFYPVFAKAIDVNGGEYGNALLTRLPLLDFEIVPIPDPPKEGKGFYESRCVFRVVLDARGTKITVLGTHFGLMPGEQQNAVKTVLKLIETAGMPVILGGDFNLRPADPLLAPLFSALRDTAGGAERIRTFPSDRPDRKIDYLFVSNDFAVLSVKSKNTQQSDHRPLIARLKLNS